MKSAFVLAAIVLLSPGLVLAEDERWVSSDRLMRRTCPSTQCGIVGFFFFREKVEVFEQKDGWVRVTKVYDASCRGGRSDYVEKGNALCDPVNGIVGGKFAEWVSSQHLAKVRPADPAKGATGSHELIKDSDDFRLHKDAFAKAAEALIASGECTAAQFKEMGGWSKSTTTYADRPVYFTYCGGPTIANRIYLDVSNGKTFR